MLGMIALSVRTVTTSMSCAGIISCMSVVVWNAETFAVAIALASTTSQTATSFAHLDLVETKKLGMSFRNATASEPAQIST